MDKLILQDKVLNQLFCSECLNYLSVGPVLISCEGKAVCGRCTNNMAIMDKELKHSLYNLLAEKLVFKCINHYQGCEELLFFNEATEHEKICHRKGIVCPFCEFAGNGCQLVHHFGKSHPDKIAKDDTFQIVVADKFLKVLIVIKNCHILYISFLVRDTRIEIFNFRLTSACENFILKFFKCGSNIKYVTPPIRINNDCINLPLGNLVTWHVQYRKYCVVLDKTEIISCFPSGWCLCKVELTDNLNDEPNDGSLNCCNKIIKKLSAKLSTNLLATSIEKIFSRKEFKLIDCLKMSISNLHKFINSELHKRQKCGTCEGRIHNSNFYFCPKYHMSCEECIHEQCPKCKVFCQWTNKSKLHNLSLACSWKGCSINIHIFEYMEHKTKCKFREYKCPDVECEFVGRRDDLKDHWHLAAIEHSTKQRVDILPQNRIFYLLWFDDLYFIVTEFADVSGKLSVTVNELDVITPQVLTRDFNIAEIDGNKSGKKRFKRTEFVKTIDELPWGNKSISFTRVLSDDEMGKKFLLERWP